MTLTSTEMSVTQFIDKARHFLDSLDVLRSADEESRAISGRKALFSSSSEAEVRRAREYQRSIFDAGYAAISLSRKEGGLGLPRDYESAFKALEREVGVPSKAPLSVSLGMVVPTLAQFGSESVKSRWLQPLRRADAVGCQLFSEPAAGSDLASVTTTAVADCGSWVIDGQKVWTSGAHYADVGIALTRTCDGPRHGNLTAFLVDLRALGVEVRPLRQMTGGSEFNEVFMSEVRVPDQWRLGEVGKGWTVALAMLGYERGAIGGSATGGAGLFRMDLVMQMIRDAGRSSDPAVRQEFARLYATVTTAKVMRTRADARAKTGLPPGPEMSLGKMALIQNLTGLSDLVSLILGPCLVSDAGDGRFEWSEFVLGVPGMRIGGGTDEVQRNIIGERILNLPKEPLS